MTLSVFRITLGAHGNNPNLLFNHALDAVIGVAVDSCHKLLFNDQSFSGVKDSTFVIYLDTMESIFIYIKGELAKGLIRVIFYSKSHRKNHLVQPKLPSRRLHLLTSR